MDKKITEIGPVGLPGIRNTDLYNSLSSLAQEGDKDASALLSALSAPKSRPFSSSDNIEAYYTPQEYQEGTPYSTLGQSRYDNPIILGNDANDVNEIRYENQSGLDVLANGYAKMLGTAATTFVSSLIGLPYGAIEAARQGRWSALWDNDVTQALAGVDNWLEENLTNYKSQKQQNSPWYDPSNLFSMNFIADDIIKNAGFTLGAAASMVVGSGALGLMGRAMGFVNNVSKGTKIANNVLSSLFAATGEGMIEARQGVEERNKLEEQRLNDELTPYYTALEQEEALANQEYAQTGDYNTYRARIENILAQKQVIDQRKEAGMQQIQESGMEMGNKILLGNQVLLTAGNLIQFSKLMSSGFDNARHAAETQIKHKIPSFVGAKRVGEALSDGYRIWGKNLGRGIAATKGILTEGSEEMNQEWIRQSAGFAYNEEDVNDYWKAKLDPESYRDTTEGLYTLGQVLDRGFNKSWWDINQWEQFVVGGLTGMAGTYAPTKIFNQDKSKSRLNPFRYGEWGGGAYKEVSEFNDQYKEYEKNINDLNKMLADGDFEARILDSVGHTYSEKQKENAALADDKKAWKDADDKQNIMDVQAFLRAGKLDDLRAIYDELSNKELTDAEVEDVIKRTTKFVTKEEDEQNHFREWDERIAAADTPEEKAALEAGKAEDKYVGKSYYWGPYIDEDGNKKPLDDVRTEIKKNVGNLSRKLDSYLESIQAVRSMTGGQLTKDQEDNLAYLHNISKEKMFRSDKILSDARKVMPSKFLLKTSKTPEQLAKETASSDLAFTRDENTPKGYVEVDTSMINDAAFATFFANNIIWGQNIRPSFTAKEIEDELAALEEDKKYSEEEQRKRREDRRKKQNELISKRDKESDKDREQQRDMNLKLIKRSLVNNAMNDRGMSLVQALDSNEYENLEKDIADAITLRSEASIFDETLQEYLRNPSKVEEKKEKTVKENAEKSNKENLDKAKMDELFDLDASVIGSIVRGDKKTSQKTKNKAKKVAAMKEAEQKVSEELEKMVTSKRITREAADDAKTLLGEQFKRIRKEDKEDSVELPAFTAKMFDSDTEVMTTPEVLLTDRDLEAIQRNNGEYDEEVLDTRLGNAKDALNLVYDAVEKRMAVVDSLIASGKFSKSIDDRDDREVSAETMSKVTNKEKEEQNYDVPNNVKRQGEESEPLLSASNPLPTRKELEDEDSVTYEGDVQTLEADMQDGTKGNNNPQKKDNNWHPWMSSTSEFGKDTNEPYEASASDPNREFKQNRYDVVREKLVESGAYVARTNGLVKEGTKVGFKVFQDINEKAGDFVIFITDETGNTILGDLPSNNPILETSQRDVSMNDLYNAIQEEWDSKTEEEKKEGMQSKYYSEAEFVLVGKVLYNDNRQTVDELFAGSDLKPKFALLTKRSYEDRRMFSGRNNKGAAAVDGILFPKKGKSGTAYVLIKTPGLHRSRGGFNYYTVPLTTYTIGETPDDTMYMTVLRELLRRIKYADDNHSDGFTDAIAKKLLQSLVAANNVHVNFSEGDSKLGPGIRMTKDKKSYVIYSGNRKDMDVEQVVRQLAKFHVNISGDYINGSDGKGLRHFLTYNGVPLNSSDYNKMISGVTYTNAARPKTVNDWFTVKPLVKDGNTLKITERKDKLPEWEDMMGGNVWKRIPPIKGETLPWTVLMTPNGYRVYDDRGREIIPVGDDDKIHSNAQKEAAWVMAAQVFGDYNGKASNEKYPVYLWGTTRVFNPEKGNFVPESSLKKSPGYIKQVQERATKEGRDLTEAEKYDVLNSLFNNYNASTASSKNNTAPAVDHTNEVNKVIAAMEEESSHWHLVKWDENTQSYKEDPEGSYYMDDRDGSVSARVSNINDADIDVVLANQNAGFNNNNPASLPSKAAGNVVDSFVRRFYRNYVKRFEGFNLNNDNDLKRAKAIAVSTANEMKVPNINNEDAANLILELAKIKEDLGPGWEINSNGLVVSGLVKLDDKNIVKVAGTIDLLAYNPTEGRYMIIDMKSTISPIFTQKDKKLKKDKKTVAKIEHWIAQQTAYKGFIESKKYTDSNVGIFIEKIYAMPFSVNYSTNFAETQYSVKDGVLFDKGISVDISPKYMGRLLEITPKKETRYDIAQLPDSVKKLIDKSSSAVKPQEKKEIVKGELMDLIDSVPKGKKLSEFVSADYLANEDVKKLIDIVELNKGLSNPIMMTSMSQKLLLAAIDRNALSKAIQEAQAAAQKIKIEVPDNAAQESFEDKLKRMKAEGKVTDITENIILDLPKDLQNYVLDNKSALKLVSSMANSSVSDIEKALRKKTTRHSKKTKDNYDRLDLPRELRWLNRNLPQISRERRLHIVKGLIMCSDGSWDFGNVEHGIMTVAEVSETGTFYHEAFHYVTQFLLTDSEIEQLHKAAVDKYGNLPAVALEERLADDFANYTKGLDYEDSRIRKFFKELWNAIKTMFSNKAYIQNLYRNINNGVYSGREFINDRVNSFSTIESGDRDVARSYQYITDDERNRLQEAGIGMEEFNEMSKDDQEYLLHCVV